MSYILDALERSEAERRRGEAPDLLMHPPAPPVEPSSWPAILALVVLVNLMVLGGLWWFVLQPSAPAPAQAAAPVSAPAAIQPAAASTAPPLVQQRAATPEPRRIAPPQQQLSAPAPVAPAPAPESDNAVPELAISSHIYSEHPDLRAVTIDGRRLQQGDSIRPGLRLLEITEDGVVVDHNGRRHRVSVLPDWGL